MNVKFWLFCSNLHSILIQNKWTTRRKDIKGMGKSHPVKMICKYSFSTYTFRIWSTLSAYSIKLSTLFNKGSQFDFHSWFAAMWVFSISGFPPRGGSKLSSVVLSWRAEGKEQCCCLPGEVLSSLAYSYTVKTELFAFLSPPPMI